MAVLPNLINDQKKTGRKNDRLNYDRVTGSSLETTAGDDLVTIQTLTSSFINLGANNDKLKVTGTTTKSLVYLGTGINIADFNSLVGSTVYGGTANDKIAANTISKTQISLGAGDDLLVINGMVEFSTLDGGAGTDRLIINSGTVRNAFEFDPQTGELSYWHTTPQSGEVWSVLKNIETVSFNDGEVKLGKGAISIYGTGRNDILSARDARAKVYLYAKEGDDTITCSFAGESYLDGGKGLDKVTFNNFHAYTVNFENGHWVVGDRSDPKVRSELVDIETLRLYTSQLELKDNGAIVRGIDNNGTYLVGTSGNDTIIGTAATDVMVATKGKDVLDLSNNSGQPFGDLIYFDPRVYEAGVNAQLTVIGFRATDQLDWTFYNRTGGYLVSVLDNRKTDASNFITGSLRLSWADHGSIDVTFVKT